MIDSESQFSIFSFFFSIHCFRDGTNSQSPFTTLYNSSAPTLPLTTNTLFTLIPVNSTSTGFSFHANINNRDQLFDPAMDLFDSSSADYLVMRLAIWVQVNYPLSFTSITGKKKKRQASGVEQVLVKTNIILDLTSLLPPSPPSSGSDSGSGSGVASSAVRVALSGRSALGVAAAALWTTVLLLLNMLVR